MGMILRIASSRIVGQGDIVGRSGYFSLNLSANSVMRGRLDARRTLKSLVADLRNNKKSAREYFDEVLSDYITRQVTRVETKSGQFLTYLSTSYKYFGYFNCMIERKSKDETVIILHKNNDLKQPILAKELEIITNRIVRVFNDMGATFTLFDEAVEIPLLKADNWNRFLTLNDADVCLTKFKDTPMLCLWIKLKQPILQNKN